MSENKKAGEPCDCCCCPVVEPMQISITNSVCSECHAWPCKCSQTEVLDRLARFREKCSELATARARIAELEVSNRRKRRALKSQYLVMQKYYKRDKANLPDSVED